MRRVRSRDTTPELIVRRILHADGLRYRLHDSTLPGRPDIVFTKARVAVFTNGCFWHMHEGCRQARVPSSHLDYWRPKLLGNRQRDKVAIRKLHGLGWKTVVIWECELDDSRNVLDRTRKALGRMPTFKNARAIVRRGENI